MYYILIYVILQDCYIDILYYKSEWHYIGEGLGSRCSVVEVVGEVGASGDGRWRSKLVNSNICPER